MAYSRWMSTGEADIGSGVGIPITSIVRPEGEATRTWAEVVLVEVFVIVGLRHGRSETATVQLYEKDRPETGGSDLVPLGRGEETSRFREHTTRAGGEEHRIGFTWNAERVGYAYRGGMRSDEEARRELYVSVSVSDTPEEGRTGVIERIDVVVWWRRGDTKKQG